MSIFVYIILLNISFFLSSLISLMLYATVATLYQILDCLEYEAKRHLHIVSFLTFYKLNTNSETLFNT